MINKEDYEQVRVRLGEIDNLGLFVFATRRILDSNCRGLIEACTPTMHDRVVDCQEEAAEIAKDIEVLDELVQITVDIMVEDLTARLEEALNVEKEEEEVQVPSLTLLKGGLSDDEETVRGPFAPPQDGGEE